MVQPSKPVSLGNVFGTSIMSTAVRDMEGTQREKKKKHEKTKSGAPPRRLQKERSTLV